MGRYAYGYLLPLFGGLSRVCSSAHALASHEWQAYVSEVSLPEMRVWRIHLHTGWDVGTIFCCRTTCCRPLTQSRTLALTMRRMA